MSSKKDKRVDESDEEEEETSESEATDSEDGIDFRIDFRIDEEESGSTKNEKASSSDASVDDASKNVYVKKFADAEFPANVEFTSDWQPGHYPWNLLHLNAKTGNYLAKNQDGKTCTFASFDMAAEYVGGKEFATLNRYMHARYNGESCYVVEVDVLPKKKGEMKTTILVDSNSLALLRTHVWEMYAANSTIAPYVKSTHFVDRKVARCKHKRRRLRAFLCCIHRVSAGDNDPFFFRDYRNILDDATFEKRLPALGVEGTRDKMLSLYRKVKAKKSKEFMSRMREFGIVKDEVTLADISKRLDSLEAFIRAQFAELNSKIRLEQFVQNNIVKAQEKNEKRKRNSAVEPTIDDDEIIDEDDEEACNKRIHDQFEALKAAHAKRVNS